MDKISLVALLTALRFVCWSMMLGKFAIAMHALKHCDSEKSLGEQWPALAPASC